MKSRVDRAKKKSEAPRHRPGPSSLTSVRFVVCHNDRLHSSPSQALMDTLVITNQPMKKHTSVKKLPPKMLENIQMIGELIDTLRMIERRYLTDKYSAENYFAATYDALYGARTRRW
ncbi:MAG: hypothetical protein RIQ56_344 [Candidatus Parcubacteria bacterium]